MRQTSSSRHDVREALRELVDRREVALNRQGELTSDTTKPSLWLLTSSPIVPRRRQEGRRQAGEFQRDRDRLLYSTALRRLAGITQVVTAEGHVVHNRLTHTLEVAQWPRRLAETLSRNQDLDERVGGVEPEVAEAAAFAHDLGHHPFGHIGEEVLDGRITGDPKIAESWSKASASRTAGDTSIPRS